MANNFKISLINVDFDNTYSNVLHFNNRQEQEEYFNVNTLFVNKPYVNLPIGTFYLTRTSINTDMEFADLMNVNYAIIKDENVGRKFDYWYYFVKNLQYTADKQVICDLELDIFNTFYIDVTFQNCLIRKAHLNRWLDNGENVKFDTSINSNLFVQEDIKPQSKYLKERHEFALCGDSDDVVNNGVLDYLDTNVIGWLYLAVDENWNINTGSSVVGSNNFLNHNEIIDKIDDYNNVNMKMPYSICCFPISKKSIKIKYNNSIYYWNINSFNSWKNDLSPYILDAYISQEPPFTNFKIVGDNIQSIYIDNGDLYIDFVSNDYLNYRVHFKDTAPLISCGVHISYITNKMHERTFTYTNVYKFNKNDIKNSPHNIAFNPKMLSQQYVEFKLGVGISEPFSYDLLKLGDNNIKINWNTSLIAGINKIFIGAKTTNIYNDKTIKSYVGCNASQDTSIPYAVSQLAQFLAQNKNFYQQRDFNIGTNLTKDLLSTFSRANKNNINRGVGETANSLISAYQTYVNSEFTIDNMGNAPQTFKNIDGNPTLTLGINNRAYYEIWECLPKEKEIADAYMNMFGYNYNQIDNIKNVDNIRHYWNFVQAEIENIFSSRVNISNIVREKFISVFSKGVRFWNVTDLVTNKTYSFTQHENYENWLDD